jgi:hypothetical protein
MGCPIEHSRGETMPQYNVDPEHIEAMRTAFHCLCEMLQLDCAVNDPTTEIVATKIVALAKAGELDPERLCSAALAELESAPASAAA